MPPAQGSDEQVGSLGTGCQGCFTPSVPDNKDLSQSYRSAIHPRGTVPYGRSVLYNNSYMEPQPIATMRLSRVAGDQLVTCAGTRRSALC